MSFLILLSLAFADISKGIDLARVGKLEEAKKEFSQQDGVNKWPAFFNDAVLDFKMQRYKDAGFKFKEVLENSSDTELKLKSLFNLANTQAKSGDYDYAKKNYKLAIKTCESVSFPYTLLYKKLCDEITDKAKKNLKLLEQAKKQRKNNKDKNKTGKDKKNNKQKDNKQKDNKQENKKNKKNKVNKDNKNESAKSKEKNMTKQNTREEKTKNNEKSKSQHKPSENKNVDLNKKKIRKNLTKDLQKSLVNRAQNNDMKLQKFLIKELLKSKKGFNTEKTW